MPEEPKKKKKARGQILHSESPEDTSPATASSVAPSVTPDGRLRICKKTDLCGPSHYVCGSVTAPAGNKSSRKHSLPSQDSREEISLRQEGACVESQEPATETAREHRQGGQATQTLQTMTEVALGQEG